MEPPDNRRLSDALRAYLEAPFDNEALFRPVLEAFVASTLIALDEEESDGDFLLLFTDLIDLHLFEAGARWVPIPAEEAIKAVAAGDFEGLLLNPGGRELELSRDDVLDFFEID